MLVCGCGGSGDRPITTTTATNSSSTPGTTTSEQIPFREADGAVTLTVGSTRSAEERLLAQIYAQALAAAGYTVKTRLTFTSPAAARHALKAGTITGYPDYSERVLTSFFGYRPGEVPASANQAAELANREFVKEGLTSYEPTPYANSAGHVIWVTTLEAPAAGPDYTKWVKHVGWKLTTPVMRRQKAAVALGQQTPQQAAAAYLKSAGYIE
jgi:glycine betaine/choline ABC-type transport system substrate-binding protein